MKIQTHYVARCFRQHKSFISSFEQSNTIPNSYVQASNTLLILIFIINRVVANILFLYMGILYEASLIVLQFAVEIARSSTAPLKLCLRNTFFAEASSSTKQNTSTAENNGIENKISAKLRMSRLIQNTKVCL